MSTESNRNPSPPRRYATGDLVAGRYRLETTIGEGGMGTVWLARNVTLDSAVALKLIRSDFDAEDAADRLLKEARAAAKIEHPAIVRVFDFGETDLGDPYIVMELLEGRSLGDTLEERGRIDPVTAVRTLLPVIDGLACAHEEGVVHRDLKPSNIFLSWEGNHLQPKVVDFGIAKIDHSDVFRKLTRQGTVLGSPAYMAPEQARGLDDVDHRADVWTICVVLYEAITGCAAFGGKNYNAVMRAVIEDDVVPITDLGVGDRALWEMLSRGLAKHRDDRFRSMHALGKALASWLAAGGTRDDICGNPLEDVWLSRQPPDDEDDEPGVLLLSRRAARADLPALEAAVDSGSTRPLVREPASIRHRRRGPAAAVTAVVGVTLFLASFTLVRAIRSAALDGPRPPTVRSVAAPAPGSSPSGPTVPEGVSADFVPRATPTAVRDLVVEPVDDGAAPASPDGVDASTSRSTPLPPKSLRSPVRGGPKNGLRARPEPLLWPSWPGRAPASELKDPY